jgi:protein-S-isoprenylcysteine O-methyltransferase Ste14
MAIGYAIYHSSFNHLLMALLIFLFFDIKASYEERRLLLRFREYWDYKVRTG